MSSSKSTLPGPPVAINRKSLGKAGSRRLRVGLNGFGRIGRAFMRIHLRNPSFDVVGVNDSRLDDQFMAYLLKHDSNYGRLERNVDSREGLLLVDEVAIPTHHVQDIRAVPWYALGADVVIDCSGDLANISRYKECDGIGNLILTNAHGGPFAAVPVVFGVNEAQVDPRTSFVLSTLTCDAAALGPVVQRIVETHEIESGFLVTLHPWLSSQNLLCGASTPKPDAEDPFEHHILGRAAPNNLIPKSTSAVRATARVIPGLDERCEAMSFRVPTAAVCGAQLTLTLSSRITRDDLIARFDEFERCHSQAILRGSQQLLVSSDLVGESYSAVLDHRWTRVRDERHVQLVYWYDSEWGYASRVHDLVQLIGDRRGL
jgi:glyceraldehyde 3-phosphate dehydrogenase